MNRYEFVAHSDRSIIERIEPFLRSIPAVEELKPEKRFNLVVATMEAVTNAIVHGNQSDVSKDVQLWVEVTDDAICVHIRDHGGGFDPDALPDPRLQENILRDGGRGVFLMRALADAVEFIPRDPGMEVVITIYR
ncbi:MAG: ATP-binding protein [Bacteroidota bacterium]|nr:ATP-binding protein [Candidatus Kapabacteria bacterium]MCS7302236.1 ATP-binding protein [Candidatus Kapabacteria bacterium]MCX7937768.1 ATP-binding protein [Chlorobiota bacterium]MDW8074856.1 ATP-binding protein [Bacteroidota bacterium]MDW8271495.1 ATP-binding protein [Bacteroidota bacterium]